MGFSRSETPAQRHSLEHSLGGPWICSTDGSAVPWFLCVGKHKFDVRAWCEAWWGGASRGWGMRTFGAHVYAAGTSARTVYLIEPINQGQGTIRESAAQYCLCRLIPDRTVASLGGTSSAGGLRSATPQLRSLHLVSLKLQRLQPQLRPMQSLHPRRSQTASHTYPTRIDYSPMIDHST